MLQKSVNHVVGDQVALVLAKSLAESSHQLGRPHEGERNRSCGAGATVLQAMAHLPAFRPHLNRF